MIIEAATPENEWTIEQLFANYKKRAHVDLQDLGEVVGNEKW
ncbi:hypothetical protein B834_186 [Enterococcus mundtii 1A]|nr:hypothetical protein [Enterococcus mundtii 1A]